MTLPEAIRAAIERGLEDAYEGVLRGDLGDFAAGGMFEAGGDVFGFGATRDPTEPEVGAWRAPPASVFLQKAYLFVSAVPSVAVVASQLRQAREDGAEAGPLEERLRRRVRRALESLAATGEAF